MGQVLRKFFSEYWILLIIVAIKLILQYILVNPVYELQRDEFLHLDQARHPAWGYISVPPLTSWISTIIFLLGGSEFWIRFFPALFGALTIIFGWFIAESLGGKLISKILVSCGLLFSILFRLNILYQPNAFEILIWTVIFFLSIKYISTEKEKWLYLLAIAVALGLYNKYNTIFLIIGLIIGIIATSQRKILSKGILWKAILFAIVLILPNIIWQIMNDFPVVGHMNALRERQLVNNDLGSFFWGQLMFFIGALPLTLAAFIAFIFYKPFRQYRYIGISFLTVMILFVILKAKDYYSIGLYPVIIAFGGVAIEKTIPLKMKKFIIPLLVLNMFGSFLVSARIIHPVMSPEKIVENKVMFEKFGVLRWEDGKNHDLPQDFSDMLGWKEMASKAFEAYNTIPDDEKNATLIFCDNYGHAGALNYYNRGKMPEAYSFNTDYIYWIPEMESIKNVILVGRMPENEITSLFSESKIYGVVENNYSREKGTAIILLKGADSSFTDLFYRMKKERIEKHEIF
ncbi:MAG: glycosyltransferase family 39 protein [Prolixibacteraceae bacterium]|nr:glycosyltransferase family 39 protein [Prolixibacteraceae bacterium]